MVSFIMMTGGRFMQKMQEEEFDKIEPKHNYGEKCEHDIVKLYYCGTHSDYGCIKCKMKSLNLEDFAKK